MLGDAADAGDEVAVRRQRGHIDMGLQGEGEH
jgi:hypothetical protein